ncbi:MAG: hypothetical protein RDV41_13565 [Planctomycetota bacterium]|nr:hypothetical protein [Planctomycetota bacterium]
MLSGITNLVCLVFFSALLQYTYLVDRQLFILSALIGLGFILTLAKLDRIEVSLSEARRQQQTGALARFLLFLLACGLVVGISLLVHHLYAAGVLDVKVSSCPAPQPAQTVLPTRSGDKDGKAADESKAANTKDGGGKAKLVGIEEGSGGRDR